MGDKTKIDWCDSSWNPVTGCLHGCEYCYARGIANRFGGHLATLVGKPIKPDEKKWEMGFEKNHVLDAPMRNTSSYEYMRIAGINAGRKMPYPFDFEPTFHRYKLDEPQHWKEPRTIFVCSMADLFGAWVPDEWIEEVFKACTAAPQHRYMFLTKAPERFKQLLDNGVTFPKNCWFGTSITRSAEAEKEGARLDKLTDTWPVRGVKWFASVEPILENLSDEAVCNLAALDWVIIGAETGRRKNKVIPKKEWITHITDHLRYLHVPVFMKKSLREIMGKDFRQEFPWGGSETDAIKKAVKQE